MPGPNISCGWEARQAEHRQLIVPVMGFLLDLGAGQIEKPPQMSKNHDVMPTQKATAICSKD